MPINWDELDQDIDDAIAESRRETDEKLADRVASITRLTSEEVKQLFPQSADAKKLAELMKVVKSAEDRNTKIVKLTAKSEEFAGVVLTLLTHLA